MTTSYWVGTDVGGTFTDMVVIDSAGKVTVAKSPTTPEDRSQGVIDAFGLAAKALDLALDELLRATVYFAHGTTAATNALIERKGEVTALLTTRGHGDTILMQRAMGSWAGVGVTSGHYSRRRNPIPIVDRKLIFEIDERTTAGGDELVPLNEEQVRDAARQLKESHVGAVAICFLWSMVRPEHEVRAAEIVGAELPGIFCSISSEIAPVIGEYERTATTVINAYLGPVIRRYVETLEQRLVESGYAGEFRVMDSAGGVLKATEAAERSIGMLMSGPAGGVLASRSLAAAHGHGNVITADMGGTSFDVGLIVGGEPTIESYSVTGSYHLAAPRVRVTAIGSGGGSLAHVDADGILGVGPESAGASPGPACYGRGGMLPTVTDADVVLGILDPAHFLGGRMQLDRRLAEQAIRNAVADPLGLDVMEAADGIRNVADHQMADLLRNVTVEQGHDPREFTVFAYGGAGPTHAYSFAEAAGIGRVVVPRTATAHSAYGTVSSDRLRVFQMSDPQRTPPGTFDPENHLDIHRINQTFEALEERCRSAFGDDADVQVSRQLFFRFRRQVHELSVPAGPGRLAAADVAQLCVMFERKYEQIYGAGTSLKGAGIEIHTFRVEGRVPPPSVEALSGRRIDDSQLDSADGALLGTRPVMFAGIVHDTSVYGGEDLNADLTGPLILEFPGTTVVVGPAQGASVRGGEVVINLEGTS
ncbi:MAG: hydantoinase/oxoprolinase family protein [Actinomycetota bacterium]|nr:hydantoinase/oxoprolinase family protein [Actinomycetota bacterium]